MSTTKTELLRKIRHKCLDCVCEQPKEVELCPATQCPLWEFRMGRDPFKTPRKLSPAQQRSLQKAWAVNARKNQSRGNEKAK
jgi:hypothetical protein